jgi:hypothetical protein
MPDRRPRAGREHPQNTRNRAHRRCRRGENFNDPPDLDAIPRTVADIIGGRRPGVFGVVANFVEGPALRGWFPKAARLAGLSGPTCRRRD